MSRKEQRTKQQQKKHHRIKKIMKLAMVTGAAYGVKKYLDSRKGFSSKTVK